MSSMMVDPEEEEAAEAFAAMQAQLKSFTSPMVGTLMNRASSPLVDDDDDDDMMVSPTTNPHAPYAMGAMEWMEEELAGEESPTKPAAEPMVTPKRTPILERAGTPVMSNSSSKRHLLEGDIDKPIEPVKTPFKVIPPPAVSPRAPMPPGHGNQHSSSFVFRRYHDALWAYLRSRRSLSHRLDLDRQHQALQQQPHDDSDATSGTSLAGQELRVELDYLATLQQLCWSHRRDSGDSNSPTGAEGGEGDCWLLVTCLRRLGLSALVWDNDAASAPQHASATSVFVQQLAAQVDETPQKLLERLASMQAPLSVQRRFSILQWSQACLSQGVPQSVEARSLSSPIKTKNRATHPDDDTPALMSESQDEQHLLQACLALVLAGRLEDAKSLARAKGHSWRAAAWTGGKPAGYEKVTNELTKTVSSKPTGNPNRFLWKRQVWKTGRNLTSKSMTSPANAPPSQQVESAIYSLLANDVQASLANAHLRTWSQGLCSTWSALWGRLEDEVLHMHNDYRRQSSTNSGGLAYPGVQYSQQESQQLLDTFALAGMTDMQALQMLFSSPFEEMRGGGSYERAMAAFILGRWAILDFCRDECSSHVGDTASGPQDTQRLIHLRFLTHLTLYLDSLQVSTTPIVLDGFAEMKDQVLFSYIKYLASRRDLWNLVALYASLLPEEQALSWYPTMLVKVTDESERRGMLEQMHELFPHMLLPVLRNTVRLGLDTATASDESKCLSLQWLLHDEQHAGEALICANVLLRQFFLDDQDDKMDVAMRLVEEGLPGDLEERAEKSVPLDYSEEMQDADNVALAGRLNNARSEHSAFQKYLEAYRTFGKWKEVMTETPTTVSSDNMGTGVDLTKLNAIETSIAKQRIAKDQARLKKQHCQDMLQAAEQARSVLNQVLTHPGGWLSIDQDDETTPAGDEESRRRDLGSIQSRYLVLAINLYHQVCEETASWMSRSLEDAKQIAQEQGGLLEVLEEEAYQPSVWYGHALELTAIIADDRHGIHQVVESNDLKEILSKLAETAISQLMNAPKYFV